MTMKKAKSLTLNGVDYDLTPEVIDNLDTADSNIPLSANQGKVLKEAVDTAIDIAKGKNKARVFKTTEAMNTWLSDEANKGLASVGDNFYIVDVGVPDWWIAEVLTEANSDGKYYEVAQLETQKVDLTTIEDAISDLEDDVNEINNDLSKGLLVDYEYLSYHSDEEGVKIGTLVTTTKTSYSTQLDQSNVHRKFSSYQYLCFELLINNNSVRASILIPRIRFTDQAYTVELTYVDSANVQRWIDVIFKDDTSFYMVGSSNISPETRVAITGLKAKL